MRLKTSEYKEYIDNILRQSFSPCYIDEVIEKVAIRLELPLKDVKDNIRSYIYRNPDILIIPYEGENKIVLRTKFIPPESKGDAILNFLKLWKKPVEQEILLSTLVQFKVITDDSTWEYDNLIKTVEKSISYYIKKESLKDLRKYDFDRKPYLIGLNTWGHVDGYYRVPSFETPISVLIDYKKITPKMFESLKFEIIKPYTQALGELKFNIRTCTDDLNELIKQIFSTSEMNDKERTYFSMYEEYMSYIKKNRDYPKKKDSPVLYQWRNNELSKGISPLLFYLCKDNVQIARNYYYRRNK